MILSAIWAPQIDKFPTLWEYLQNALSYIAPPIVSLFVVGIFWERVNHQGALAAIITGIIGSIIFLLASNTNLISQIHFLYIAGILFLICLISIIVVSLLTEPPSKEKIKDITWSANVYHRETLELCHLPVYKNYRVQAFALMILLAVILIVFR